MNYGWRKQKKQKHAQKRNLYKEPLPSIFFQFCLGVNCESPIVDLVYFKIQ